MGTEYLTGNDDIHSRVLNILMITDGIPHDIIKVFGSVSTYPDNDYPILSEERFFE